MAREKIVPCLVLDPKGKTEILLDRGPRSAFDNPIWTCSRVECPIRGNHLKNGISVYDSLEVGLKTVGGIHGIAWCQGGGKTERK